ncbi:TB2/DP1, HVA22 family-domain-containing protein, partial [Hygrophoropsis aurantiaca]
MLFYLTSCIISSGVAFLYPGYASYKTLSQRPASEEDLERWLMYWSVLGCIVGVEYVAEWLISWIPFYYPIKTLFLLYLALPQTRGSSYLYINHLQPFFQTHEAQIDATLASLKARAYAFIQERLRALWEQAAGIIGQQQQAHFNPAGGITEANTGAPPSMGDPASGPAQVMMGLWRSYGPAVMATGAALMRQGATGAATSAEQAWQAPANSSQRPGTSRQLSSQSVPAVPSLPVPPASGSFSSRSSSGSELRERTSSFTGRFEEVDVPSDAEGYDVNGGDRPDAKRATSWFGWGGSTASEREKS